MTSMKRPRLKAVQAHPGFMLKLTFVNGQIFDLDLNNDIEHYPGLKPLHDAEAFAAAAISNDGWTVEWPELDIQIGADTLYLDALTQSAPDENTLFHQLARPVWRPRSQVVAALNAPSQSPASQLLHRTGFHR